MESSPDDIVMPYSYKRISEASAGKFRGDDDSLKSAITKLKSECDGTGSEEEEDEEEETHGKAKKKPKKIRDEESDESDESSSGESEEKASKKRRKNRRKQKNNNDYSDEDDSQYFNNRNSRRGNGRYPYQNRENSNNNQQNYNPYQYGSNSQNPFSNRDQFSGNQNPSYGYGYPTNRPSLDQDGQGPYLGKPAQYPGTPEPYPRRPESFPGRQNSYPSRPIVFPSGQDMNKQNPYSNDDFDQISPDFDPFGNNGGVYGGGDMYPNRRDPFSYGGYPNDWNKGNDFSIYGRSSDAHERHKKSSDRKNHKNKKSKKVSTLDDEEVCISKCVFTNMEVMDDDEIPAESAVVKWAQDNLKNEKFKTGAVKQIRKCFGTIASASSEDACEVSRSLSSCLKLELEDDD